MTYAFILATNVYISHQKTVSYADNDSQTEFLKILTYQPGKRHDSNDKKLVIDASIAPDNGDPLTINNNVIKEPGGYQVQVKDNQVNIFKENKEILLEVIQLAEGDFKNLQSHINNEIRAQNPEAVFIIKGDFWVSGRHIIIDNEKLFVGDDTYATGVTNNPEGVMLTPYDVLQ